MEAKIVKNKKIAVLVTLLLLSTYFYGQSKDTIYFLVNKNDTLIKKHLGKTSNEYHGYTIFEDSIVKKSKRVSRTKEGIWVPESQDTNAFKFSFSFIKEQEKIITNAYLTKLEIISSRKEFLKIHNKFYDCCGTTYFFIESMNNSNKYFFRKVHPVVLE